ncbi:MAG: hypothetical protein FJY65_11710, partial [Calditrichaeota bacterium]|nr:hypothetical protein [Calditrichota bacterium]
MNPKHFIKSLTITLLIVIVPVVFAQNNCLRFNNSHHCMAISNVNHIPERNITIEFWFRTQTANGGLFSVTAQEIVFNDYDRSIYLQNGRLFQYTWTPNRNETIQSQNADWNDGRWHHYALVLQDNQGQRMYVDGNLQASGNLDGSGFDWADRFEIGYTRQVNYFTGDMDELRYWSRPLTQDEIRALKDVPLRGDEQGLIAYYRFDEGQGQSVADDSQNNFPMRLGAQNGQDAGDPQWVSPGAPISGAVAEISARVMNFRPLAVGRSSILSLTLSNLAQIIADLYALNYRFTDMGGAPNWLRIAPVAGIIPARQQVQIRFTADAQDLQPGRYQRTVRLTTNARDYLQVDIPVTLTVCAGMGRMFGQVTDARNREPVEGVLLAAAADYDLSATTDEQGFYEFVDLAAQEYTFNIIKADYLPIRGFNIDVPSNDEREQNFALLHSVCEPRPARLEFAVPTDDVLRTTLAIRNPG